jgi:hypothetical protein
MASAVATGGMDPPDDRAHDVLAEVGLGVAERVA